MTPDYLVDTDVFIDFLRGYDRAVAFIRTDPSRIVLSPIVLAELYAGARGDEEVARLDDLARLFPTRGVSTEVARAGGLLRAEYGKSHGLGLADALLAATARHYSLALKTLNVRHFPMFPGLTPPYRK